MRGSSPVSSMSRCHVRLLVDNKEQRTLQLQDGALPIVVGRADFPGHPLTICRVPTWDVCRPALPSRVLSVPSFTVVS
jgi:hypothetical protein